MRPTHDHTARVRWPPQRLRHEARFSGTQLQSSSVGTQSGLEPKVYGTQAGLHSGPTVGRPYYRHNPKSDKLTRARLTTYSVWQPLQQANPPPYLCKLWSYKGGPNSVSKNHISLRCQNQTKTSSMYLLTLIMTMFPFLFCWWKSCRISKACDRGASRLGEVWPRPRLGRKTDWHKDKARLTGTRCWSPSKAPESWNSSVARPWN